MGAFFAFQKTSPVCVEDARQVFVKKGFTAPQEFQYGSWTLWHFGKILSSPQNFILGENGTALHACGTVVYRGLGYRDSLQRLLADFQTGQVDQEQLLGSFSLLFWDGKTLSILLDRSRIYKVFGNEEHTCLSSSFLALVAASPVARPLNRLACCEKLSSGFIVAPDTLVDGIHQVDADVANTYHAKEGVCFASVRARPEIVERREKMADSVARQVSCLETHFRAMDALHMEANGELGMSSGFDSRLILACGKFLTKPMDMHTHGSQGIHDAEMAIVKQIAEHQRLPLRVMLTQNIEDCNATELTEILDDGLHLYDGRSSFSIGAYSPVYTRAYNAKLMENHRFGWNGLGGEMYRNNYFTPHRPVTLTQWMNRHVYYPFAQEAWGNADEFAAMHTRKTQKMARRLGTPVPQNASLLWLRRYYSEICMPDGQAARNDAMNQLMFLHTPFMDSELVASALGATPQIGFGGTFQAALIRAIDPDLASLPSHYGYTFSGIPVREKLKAFMKCQVSKEVQRQRIKKILRQNAPKTVSAFHAHARPIPILREIQAALSFALLRGPFEDALLHYAQKKIAIFVGSFLCAYQQKIRM